MPGLKVESSGWLRDLLNMMRKDIAEIKKDVKALQKSKFMFDGAKEAVRIVVTVAITLFTLWLKAR